MSHLRLVPPPRPVQRRHPPYVAQISIRGTVIGRSRPFTLTQGALERLLAAAAELERAAMGEARQRPALGRHEERKP